MIKKQNKTEKWFISTSDSFLMASNDLKLGYAIGMQLFARSS